MKPITIWYKYNADRKEYEHNHIEDGHVDNATPIPKFDSQKCWNGFKWKKNSVWLHDGKIYDHPFCSDTFICCLYYDKDQAIDECCGYPEMCGTNEAGKECL